MPQDQLTVIDKDRGDDTSTQHPKRNATTRRSDFVKDSDLLLVLGVAGVTLLVLVLFGTGVFVSGIVDFPDMTNHLRSANVENYYMDALAFRERRVGLALVLRTFLTGFSFVVGLALCTMGGLFILRQVTSLTTISAGAKKPSDGQTALAAEGLKELSRSQIAFSAYSPGVVFLLGGVIVMGITQYFAIPIKTVDVTLPVSVNWCQDPSTGNINLCETAGSSQTADAALEYCLQNPGHEICKAPEKEENQ